MAIAIADAAKVLAAAGKMRITEAMIRADLEAGAPTNDDGTINLLHYTAWMVQQLGEANSGD